MLHAPLFVGVCGVGASPHSRALCVDPPGGAAGVCSGRLGCSTQPARTHTTRTRLRRAPAALQWVWVFPLFRAVGTSLWRVGPFMQRRTTAGLRRCVCCVAWEANHRRRVRKSGHAREVLRAVGAFGRLSRRMSRRSSA